MLKILEIDITKLRPIISPTKFQNIILPDESFFYSQVEERIFFTNEYRETVERIKNFAQKNFMALDKKKFYFFHGINQLGEERLARYFESKGYAIVHAARVPLEAELNILANCESFASTLGSCAHNMIFMKADSEVILIPRSCYLTSYQPALNDLQAMDIKYIDSTFSLFQKTNGGPFCYIISEQLKNFFGDEWTGEYSDEDFITFLVYVRYSLSKNHTPLKETKEYYSTVFPEFLTQLKKHDDLMKRCGIFLK